MGSTSSKGARYPNGYGYNNHYPGQYPYPRATQHHFPVVQQAVYPQPVVYPQQAFPQPGYGQPVMPPPPTMYPQQGFFPQPQQQPPPVVYIERGSRRRKSRRRSSRRHSSRHRRDSSPPAMDMDRNMDDHAPVIPDMHRNVSQSHHRAESSAGHRLPHMSRHSDPVTADAAARLRESVHFDSTNRLPEPPRDLYNFTPHRSVLTMEHTAALLTGAMSDRLAQQARSRKGFRRFFSKKPRDDQRYIPIQHAGNGDPSRDGYAALQRAAQENDRGPSNVGYAHALPSNHSTHDHAHVGPPRTMTPVVPPPGSFTPAPTGFTPVPPPGRFHTAQIVFGQSGDPNFNDFELYSPYRVMFNSLTYPTAYHLFEAKKFMETAPEVAEQIRRAAGSLQDLAHIVHANASKERGDWMNVVLMELEDVQRAKFLQHPNLLQKLKDTGDAELVYGVDDAYWGGKVCTRPDGTHGPGENYMGKSLMQVRQQIQANQI